MLPSFRVLLVLFALLYVSAEASPDPPATVAGVSSPAPVILIGFVGGFVRHDDRVHMEVKLVDRLKEEYSSGMFGKTFENHHGKAALKEVLRLLDANRDGDLSPEEKQNARIIIFGHSWGASQTVELARQHEVLYKFLLNKWYFDEIYDAIFVEPTKKLGRLLWKGGDGWLIDGFGPDGVSARVLDVTRSVIRLQSGYLYHYAFAMLIGAALFITWFMFAFR